MSAMSVELSGDFRIERDTMGEVRVPAEALYQAQTQRAIDNFPISGVPIDPALIRALGLIKGAAARVNADLGVLDREIADAIHAAAQEVAGGRHDHHFPLDVFQTGSGTSSNMNANEVLASLAADDPRRRPCIRTTTSTPHSRATTSFPAPSTSPPPTASSTASSRACGISSSPWPPRPPQFATVVKSGRTHLMDATPVTLGQEFGGYAAPDPVRRRADRGRPAAGGGTAARRHRRRNGHQHPARLRRGRHRPAGGGNPAAVHGGARPLRGPGRPGRSGRGLRRAPHHRGEPEQDRQRPALDGFRSDAPVSGEILCPTCSRVPRSCRARSIR